MKFRKLQQKDEVQLSELFKQLTKKKITFNAKSLIQNKSYHCLVLEHKNQVIGFGALYVYQDPLGGFIGIIESVVVDEDFRGRKLGKKLMEKLIKIGKEKKVKKINLTSNLKRVIARNLYRSLGFIDTGFSLKL